MRHTLNKFFKHYDYYLYFMLIAYGGAFFWQMFLPDIAETMSTWGKSIGWQREIALWNVGIITAIIYALIKKEESLKRILTLQSAVLCVVLGLNHAVSFFTNMTGNNLLHLLGIMEVLLLGGIWGFVVFVKNNKNEAKKR